MTSALPLQPTELRDEDSCVEPASCHAPSRKLLTAWLLLLLDDHPAHGYELRRRIDAHGLGTDPAAIYRVLRSLEHGGSAASSWARSDAGPRRRLYHLTAQGRRDLADHVAAITVTRDVYAAFLQAHRQSRQEPRSTRPAGAEVHDIQPFPNHATTQNAWREATHHAAEAAAISLEEDEEGVQCRQGHAERQEIDGDL